MVVSISSTAHGGTATADGNILRIGIQLEPPNLDPTQGAAAAIDEIVYANVFEGLTAIGPEGTIVPRLAHAWEIDDAGRMYRFYLREGVRFHDGTPFDAHDVKFSLERAKAADSSNAQRTLFEPIQRIDILDSHTLEIHLSHTVGEFLHHLSWGDAVIVGPESADTNSTQPIGTGPFKFLRWRKGVGIDLGKQADYWGAPAHIDGVSFVVVPDPMAAFASLMAGDLDGFPNYPAPENLYAFEENANFDVVTGSTEGETILALNHRVEALQDVRVRRALTHAIDKHAIIEGALFGLGQPIGSHFPPHHPAYVELNHAYPYDPDTARSLLREAGFTTGLELTLKLPPPSYARRAGEVVAAQLSKVGVEVTIENLEWAQWLNQVFSQHDFDLTIVAHTEPMDLDIYARDDYYFGYQDPEYKSIIRKLSHTQQESQRNELLKRAQRKLSDDAVNVFLFQGPKVAVWAKGVEGAWQHAPIQANDVSRVTRQGLSATSSSLDAASGLSTIPTFLLVFLGVGIVVLAYRAGFAYVARRLTSIAVTLLAATLVIFLLVEVAPGDTATFMMGLNAQPEALAALREELGLDQSIAQRYLSWVGGMLQGDFGTSYTYRTPILELILGRLEVSLPLAIYAILLAVVFAIPAGLVAARRRGQVVDGLVMGATQVGIALPNFWFAILLVIVFASGLRWFPVGGFPGWEAGYLNAVIALTLPAIALAIPQAAILARIVRSSLLDTLTEDYIRTARAKGLTQSQVLTRHALGNAAIPVLTILGLQFSFLLAGAIIIENVFYLPGLGRLVFQAILQRDLIVVESVVFLLAFATVIIAFVVDLAYAAVDPRIRLGASQ